MYKLITVQGIPLTGFHSNGGWELDDVFPCDRNSYEVYESRDRAEQRIQFMLQESEKQRDRWGEWTEVAKKFISTLTIVHS